MAKNFQDLSETLQVALEAVTTARVDAEEAAKVAAEKQGVYQSAIQEVRIADAAYRAFVNEAMTGFAQTHQ